MNRTWNPATGAEPWLNNTREGIDGAFFAPFKTIDYSYALAPEIPTIDNCDNYEIRYYDPYTLEEVGTATDGIVWGNSIVLKNFPALTMERPYVLFKILRTGNCLGRK
jgi:hypothetical protein